MRACNSRVLASGHGIAVSMRFSECAGNGSASQYLPAVPQKSVVPMLFNFLLTITER